MLIANLQIIRNKDYGIEVMLCGKSTDHFMNKLLFTSVVSLTASFSNSCQQ